MVLERGRSISQILSDSLVLFFPRIDFLVQNDPSFGFRDEEKRRRGKREKPDPLNIEVLSVAI